MKPLGKPLSCCILKPTSPNNFLSSRYEHKLLLHSLVSYFLCPELSQEQPQIPQRVDLYLTKNFPSSSYSRFITSPFTGSPKQPKSLTKSTNFSPQNHQNYGNFGTHFLDSCKNDRLQPKFAQKRPFSAASSDTFSKSMDSLDAIIESSAPIDAGSSMRKPISLWPGMYHSPVTNALWEARSSIFERLTNVPVDAPPQSELITRTPSMSRTSILYKFSTDYILREQYRNPWNEIRLGKLLEDLDALAGTVSFKKHVLPQTQ